MYYIQSTPDADGNHGPPQGNSVSDMLILPDELLKAYIDTMGFALLTVDEGTVTAVEVNQAAYDAYQADHPPVPATSLWSKIADPAEEWPEWSQPVGAHDAYQTGDKVAHDGEHWISAVDNNVWEPGVYGWGRVDDE